ncbi:MAG: YoaK family protein [Acidimicrobiales bacterium]
MTSGDCDPGGGASESTGPTGPTGRASKELVARVLAAVGGYVDGVGYVALFRLFTAHQSGNSAGLGVALGAGDWTDAWRRGIAIAAYVVGVALGTLLVELGRLRGLRSTGSLVGAVQIAILCSALGLGEVAARSGKIAPADTTSYALTAACLAGAMGLQTVTLRRVGRSTVRTTFVTGVLTDMAESLVASWFRRDRAGRQRLRSSSWLLGSVWVLYLGGAVLGGVAERAWSFAALAVPIVVVAIVAGWQFREGYQPSIPEQRLSG